MFVASQSNGGGLFNLPYLFEPYFFFISTVFWVEYLYLPQKLMKQKKRFFVPFVKGLNYIESIETERSLYAHWA